MGAFHQPAMDSRRVLLLCLLAWGTVGVVYETVYTSTLTPNQVYQGVVDATNSNFYGLALCRVLRYSQPALVGCEIQHNVDEVTRAAIYRGEPGTQGAFVTNITVTPGYSYRVSFPLTQNSDLIDFLDGGYYIELTALDYRGGAIRGQILQEQEYYAELLPRNTVPRASGTNAEGIVIANFDAAARRLDLNAIHDVTRPLSLEIRTGGTGEIGRLEDTLPGTSPLHQSQPFTRTETDSLLAQAIYLNVPSQNNPLGDIRGPLTAINSIEEGSYSSVLVDGAGTPRGVAIFSLNCVDYMLQYSIYHNVSNVQSAYISVGNNTVLYSLPTMSPALGRVQMLPNEVASLVDGELLVTLLGDFDSEVNNTVTGSIGEEYSYFAYLTGLAMVPSVTTHNGGIMLMNGNNNTLTMEYILVHTVERTVDIAIYAGRENTNPNRIIYDIPDDIDFLSQNVTEPLGQLYSLIFTEPDDSRSYVQISSRGYPDGVLRGQVRAFAPCNPNLDREISVGEDSFGTLGEDDTSVLNYISSNVNQDDDEFDIYVQVIDPVDAGASSLSLSLLLSLGLLLLISV